MRLAPALLFLAALPASADERWLLVTDAPLAVPISTAQRDRFGVGAMPSFGVYRSLAPYALVGARVRGGFLSDGAPPPTARRRLEGAEQASRSGRRTGP